MKASALFSAILALSCLTPGPQLSAQTLLNLDFGVGSASAKVGFAATGQSTNDYWNLYRHYDPKFLPGSALIADGALADLRLADGTPSPVRVALTNAPGVWGNATGDPMYDTYLFAQNGSNIVVTLTGLEAGRYHFYLYGHADPDVTGEQLSRFVLQSGTNRLGPLTTLGSAGWKTSRPWEEGYQFVVFRDVEVQATEPVRLDVTAGANGVPVLNGLQIISRGTSPPRLLGLGPEPAPDHQTNLIFRSVQYEGRLLDHEARFAVELEVESLSTNLLSGPLFEGEVAVFAPSLPAGVRIVSDAKVYRLLVAHPGQYRLSLELVAKIVREEPWNRISFRGPPAAIASVSARAAADGVEMELLQGTQMEPTPAEPATSRLRGWLGPDRQLAMRWQSKAAEITRRTLLNVDTSAEANVTPTVIHFLTRLRYEILQAGVSRLEVLLPAGHTLTRVDGPQIRDWETEPDGGGQRLRVDLVKPMEKSYELVLNTEQTVADPPATASLDLPRPLGVERESGSLTLSANDMLVKIDALAGLRQVNAPDQAVAAFRFFARPISLTALLRRIEPSVQVTDRVTARLEESRLLVSHRLHLNVEKAGIYTLELEPPNGMVVSEIRGEGLDDWSVQDGLLRISLASRLLGQGRFDVELEQAHAQFPDQIVVTGLPVRGASRQTAQIGAAPALGIQLKTAGDLQGLREIPVTALPDPGGELLAFAADTAQWRLTLAAEQLAARIMADVFNLITVGDGLVGGSATIRFGLLNQGVQAFQVRLPDHWKNLEFTGPNIRRKEQNPALAGTNDTVWTLTLQDKAWGGYTLVITYDYQFDPKQDTLDFRGAHVVGAERETGSLAVTTAASLELQPGAIAEPLRLIDAAELAEADRALISRPVLLAYRYAGDAFELSMQVTRHEQVPVLDAVADRTQITSVLTEEGQMLTQASFMVKNNDKQFQKFQLPAGAELWACYVNNQPVKAETDGDWLLVSLPRGANRDEAFAVDLVYKQTFDSLRSRLLPKRLALAAPTTDVPNTYAEWALYVPASQQLSHFGGSMTVAQGTTYGFRDAWARFLTFYSWFFRQLGQAGGWLIAGATLILILLLAALTKGWRGILAALGTLLILALLAAIILPSFTKARSSSQKSATIANLKQLSGAIQTFQLERNRLPLAMSELNDYIREAEKLGDTETGRPFVYVGQGKSIEHPDALMAYSSNGRYVLYANGDIKEMNQAQFAAALEKDAQVPRQLDQQFQTAAQGQAVLDQQQLVANQPPPAAPPVPATPVFMLGRPASAQEGAPPDLAAAPPTAAGLRSIRIDLPKTGQAFRFTKVLNVRDEPLSIEMRMMRDKVRQAWRSAWQAVFLLAGFGLLWRYGRRPEPNSFGMTLGLMLALGSLSSFLTGVRGLHVALIVGAPLLALLLAGWIIWHRLARRRATSPARTAMATHLAIGSLGWAVCALSLAGTPAQAVPLQPSPATNAVSILRAAYSGQVSANVAELDAVLEVVTAASNQVVTLFGGEVAVRQFEATNGQARLVRPGQAVAAQFDQPGQTTLRLQLAVALGGDITKRQLTFDIPPALASQLRLTLAEPDADVEFPSAVSFQRRPGQDQTEIEAILGAGARVDLRWTPRMKRAAEVAAHLVSQSTTLITVGGGVINTRAALQYQVVQGELRQARVALPPGQHLLRVEGEAIRTWELREENGQSLLEVDLLKGMTDAYPLTVETEALLETLPARLTAAVPHPLGVLRETGLIGLRGTEELTLNVVSTRSLQRLDLAEFAQAAQTQAEGLVSAYRFLTPDFELAAQAEAIQPQVEAVVHHGLRVGLDQLTLHAQVDYTVKKVGVFNLRLALPDGYQLESLTGPDLQQWTEKKDPPSVEVALKKRTMGHFSLNLRLNRRHPDRTLPASLPVAGVLPLDLEKLTGYVAVSADPGVGTKTAAFEGLTEIPAASLPDSAARQEMQRDGRGAPLASVLAFKYLPPANLATASWSLQLNTELLESWVRVDMAHFVTVSESLLSGRTVVRYEIQNAPLQQFTLQLPETFKNVEIEGANIRRRDQTGGTWNIELQHKVHGNYQLVVSWEESRHRDEASLTLTGLQARGAERETGFVIILTKPPLQVLESATSEELVRIDTRELPEWAGSPASLSPGEGAVPVLVYRYLRPGFVLGLASQRFEEATLLQALVDSGQFTTVVADDGQMMTEMKLNIRNNGLQYLELQLPPQSIVWSVFVAGQPVRPAREGDRLLIPLERSAADDDPFAVEVIYIGAERFPKTHGTIRLASPRLALPLKNVRWELYLPSDFQYDDFEGSMQHEEITAPVLQVFSQTDYSRQEDRKKSALRTKIQSSLSNVRANLTQGQLKGANYYLNQAMALNSKEDLDANRQLEELQKEVSRAQSSNLIQAQQTFMIENADRFGQTQVRTPAQQLEQPQQAVLPNQTAQVASQPYQEAAAEAQWRALARAQEITVTRVRPLRVNLPTRGLLHAFTQTLQTEPGQPMTIQFQADSTRQTGWLKRLLLLGSGFCLLWLALALFTHRTRPAPIGQ